jgi:hypothetical protein
MIPLDSSHPFDRDGYIEATHETVERLSGRFGWNPVRHASDHASQVVGDIREFERTIPGTVEVFLSYDFRSPDRSYGIEPIGRDEMVMLRRSMRSNPGLPTFLGKAFLPLFYLGEGATLYVYLPLQTEYCADSFVVGVEIDPFSFAFVANGVRKLFSSVGAVAFSVAYGSDFGTPPMLKKWMS